MALPDRLVQTTDPGGPNQGAVQAMGSVQDEVGKLYEISDEEVANIGGTADAITGNLDPILTTLNDGKRVWLNPTTHNTSSQPTLNIGVGGDIIIEGLGGVSLVPGDLKAGRFHQLRYSAGTNRWRLIGGAVGIAQDLQVDAEGLFSARSTHDNEVKGFTFFATDQNQFYQKITNAIADWSSGFFAADGPVGPQGPQGIQGEQGPGWNAWQGAWVTSTAYAVNDAVENGGSAYIATSAHTSSASTEPGVGASWQTVWDLVAQKGADGAGTGDVVGPGSATDRALALYSGTTGKLIKDGPALGTSGHPLVSGGAGTDPSFAQIGTAGLSDNAVTSAKLADMPAYTLKARDAGTTGDPSDVDINTLTEVTAPADGDLVLLKLAGAAGAFRKMTAANAGATENARTASVVFLVDGGGSVISTGIAGDLRVDFGGTIKRATLLADQVGSIVVDIYKDTLANYPPVVADSISASAKPTITSDDASEDSTLTGWTTAFNAGDIFRFNVDSVTTVTRCTVVLEVLKS